MERRSFIAVFAAFGLAAGCGTRDRSADVLDQRLIGEWRVVEHALSDDNVGARLVLRADGGYQIDSTVTAIFRYFSAGTWRIDTETNHIVLVDRGTFGRTMRYRDERTLVRTIADYDLLSEDELRLDFVTIRSEPALDRIYMFLARTAP